MNHLILDDDINQTWILWELSNEMKSNEMESTSKNRNKTVYFKPIL